ncbi:Uu.00g071120.m01.CDS01 [Anthostomella pinea]|uniref:Uu.00g071120.m01.CDS01 n=1 Tax=Anthostomella pinea TaxID=933095 RepID=A0AAI8VUT2_9PEZI|nr:Uu.00g071120.m01.CDS01 [Anthostomella pinea]
MDQVNRKRKATTEAADEERRKRLRRIDPFRSLSPLPATTTTTTAILRGSLMKRKKKTPTPQTAPLPVLFLNLPAANAANQITATCHSSHSKSTLLACKTLLEHNHQHGNTAMPDQKVLKNWLEANKRDFVKARRAKRATRQDAQRVQTSPRPATADVVAPLPAAAHPAVRPVLRQQQPAPVPNGGILPGVRRSYRRLCHGITTGLEKLGRGLYPAADIEDAHLRATQEQHEAAELAAQLERQHEQVTPAETQKDENEDDEDEDDEDDDYIHRSDDDDDEEPARTPALVGLALSPSAITPIATRTIRAIAPPLDPRFFHPDGRLQGIYKYLTAQIPLPRQWVAWAQRNGITYVHGRGDIIAPGVYVADDTFDYDALHQAIHGGTYRTGRREIVRSMRDHQTHDLELDAFPAVATETAPDAVAPAPTPADSPSAASSSPMQAGTAEQTPEPQPTGRFTMYESPLSSSSAGSLSPISSPALCTPDAAAVNSPLLPRLHQQQEQEQQTPARPTGLFTMYESPLSSSSAGSLSPFSSLVLSTPDAVNTPLLPRLHQQQQQQEQEQQTPGSFGLPSHFYDASSESESNPEAADTPSKPPPHKKQQPQQQPKRPSANFLARSRAELRRSMRIAGEEKDLPSPTEAAATPHHH